MMFNHRFCSIDHSIMFKPEEWSCTDPDQCQFCREISDTEFEYIQLKPRCELIDEALNPPRNKTALEYLSGRTFVSDWYEDIIDVDKYDDDEVAEYLSPYGYDFANFNRYKRGDNQIIAECIFETDTVMGF